jgi:hypothetical protein
MNVPSHHRQILFAKQNPKVLEIQLYLITKDAKVGGCY